MQNLTPDHHIQLIVHCAQGQTILIGPNIAVKVNNTYLRKHDRRSCVSLTIEAPLTTSIYQTCVNLKKPDALPSDNVGEAANVSFNSITKEPPVSSAAKACTESAHGVNTAPTQYVQSLSAQNALEAISASNAVRGKSNGARMKSEKTLTTPQGNHPTLTVKPARSTAAKRNAAALGSGTPTKDAPLNSLSSSAALHDVSDVNHSPLTSPVPLSHSNGRIVSHDNTLSKAMATSQDALPETLLDVVTEPLQAPKKSRVSRKKSPAAQITAEVLA